MNVFKYFRKIFLVNQVVAFFIKTFRLKLLEPKWPLKGVVNLKVSQVKIKFYSNCDDYLVSNFYYSDSHEELMEIEYVIDKLIKSPSPSFIDIGAYNGLFSLVISRCFPQSKVFAIEPNPTNFARLKMNIEINGLHNIQSYEIGMSDLKGELEVFMPADFSLTTGSSCRASWISMHTRLELGQDEIGGVSLDEFCKKNAIIPDLIKIDVEGHEFEVLKGAKSTIEAARPIILCEVFTKHFYSKDEYKRKSGRVFDMERFLRANNYSINIIRNDSANSIASLNFNNPNRNFLFLPN